MPVVKVDANPAALTGAKQPDVTVCGDAGLAATAMLSQLQAANVVTTLPLSLSCNLTKLLLIFVLSNSLPTFTFQDSHTVLFSSYSSPSFV